MMITCSILNITTFSLEFLEIQVERFAVDDGA